MSQDPLDLPEHLRLVAKEELGENPEIRRTSLEILRTKISELPEADRLADVSDLNLIRFLSAH
jgi:hypothetical protein